MEVVALGAVDDRGVADQLEAKNVAIELHGRWHVEDLEERTKAVKIERHGSLLRELGEDSTRFRRSPQKVAADGKWPKLWNAVMRIRLAVRNWAWSWHRRLEAGSTLQGG